MKSACAHEKKHEIRKHKKTKYPVDARLKMKIQSVTAWGGHKFVTLYWGVGWSGPFSGARFSTPNFFFRL